MASQYKGAWTLEKATEFIAKYQSTPTKELANEMGRSDKAIQVLARKSYILYPHLRPARGKYKERVIPAEYLIAHFNRDMTHKEIADHFGVKRETVYTSAARYKKEGFDIIMQPYNHTHPEGYIRVGHRGTEQKVNGKWLRVKRPPKPKPVISPKEQRVKIQNAEAQVRYKQRRAELAAMKKEDLLKAIAKRQADNEAKKLAAAAQKRALRTKESEERAIERKRLSEARKQVKIEAIKTKVKDQARGNQRESLRQERKEKAAREYVATKVQRTDLIEVAIPSKRAVYYVPPERLEAFKNKTRYHNLKTEIKWQQNTIVHA